MANHTKVIAIAAASASLVSLALSAFSGAAHSKADTNTSNATTAKTRVKAHMEGSGVIVRKSRPITDFHSVDMACSADVDIVAGSKPTFEISGDDNLVDHLIAKVVDGTLFLSEDVEYNSKKGLKCTVTVPSLRNVDMSGSGDMYIRNITAGSFAIKHTGSGDMHVSGNSEKLDLEADGSGDINAAQLKCADATITAPGSGDVKIAASRNLRVTIDGSGDVSYSGKPKIQKEISGSGNLQSLEAVK